MGRKMSITAFVLSLLFFIPLVPIAGFILGIIATIKAKDDPNALKGLAIAAIVIGAIFGIFGQMVFGIIVANFIRGYMGYQLTAASML